jgi:hypothetical protein
MVTSARLAAIENATLFRVFLNDGTAVVSYGEFARVGDRVVFSLPIVEAAAGSAAAPHLQVVNIPATAVDWAATAKYAASARFSHYVATNAETDYAALTAEVAGVLNSIRFVADPKARLDLATRARRRLATWPQDHLGYRAEDVRQVLGLLDELVSDLRASAGESAFSLDLVASLEPPAPAPLQGPPTAAESIVDAVAIAKVTDVPADRIAILRAVVAAIDDSGGAGAVAATKPIRRWAVSVIDEEAAADKQYSQLASTLAKRASNAAAHADVRGVEEVLTAAQGKDALMGRRRPDVVQALLGQIEAQLDAARALQLARDRWRERVDTFRAYQNAVAPVLETLRTAQQNLDNIKTLAGSEPGALVFLSGKFDEGARRLSAISVPDELKPVHALLQSALALADNAVKTRRSAVISGELRSAWDASSAAAGSMMLFAKAREDMEATVKLPRIR